MEKLNPLVDFAFKKLFGVDENKDILIDLINAVVSPDDQIVDLVIKNPYNEKSFKHDKLSILDIKAQGANKRWYVIEMQIMNQDYFDSRALYYWSRIYHGQLASGINFDCLEKTISINFLNFNCLDEENYHNTYKLKNLASNKDYPNDHVEIHFVELKKYHETLSTMLDKWANFLVKAYEYDLQHLPKELQIPTIEKAVDALEHMYLNDDERESYEARLKWLRDEEMALKKAKEEGIATGKAEGFEEGSQKKAIEIAKSMFLRGMALEVIAEISGLSPDDLAPISGKSQK